MIHLWTCMAAASDASDENTAYAPSRALEFALCTSASAVIPDRACSWASFAIKLSADAPGLGYADEASSATSDRSAMNASQLRMG